MRTTVNIDEHLLTRAKQVAVSTGRSLGEVIDDSLRTTLAARRTGRTAVSIDLPVFGGSGLRPGVDLENKEQLADVMDATEPADAAR